MIKLDSLVKMTNDALDNYGENYRNQIFKVVYVARNTKEHPGYDMGVYPMKLFDLENPATHEMLECSLYEYELIQIK